MRERLKSNARGRAHPASGDSIYSLPQGEIKDLFYKAINKQTPHPVRDTWRAWGALSLESRKGLSADSLQALLAIQTTPTRRPRYHGRLTDAEVHMRANAVLRTASKNRWSTNVLGSLLSQCLTWIEQIESSREKGNLDALLSNLSVVIQGFAEQQTLSDETIRKQILRAMTLCHDLLVLWPAHLSEAIRKQALSSLGPWIERFWLSRYTPQDEADLVDVQILIADVCLLLEREGSRGMARDLACKAASAGMPVQRSALPDAETKAPRSVSAIQFIKAYHALVSQGKQPDERLYRAVLRDFRAFRREGVPFPELRLAAMPTQWSQLRGVSNDARVLADASPEQMFRLAVQSEDFELSNALYNLLKAHHSFRWGPGDAHIHKIFFLALKDYALRETAGPRRPGDLDQDLRRAAKVYLDYRADIPNIRTHSQASNQFLMQVLAKTADPELLAEGLHSYLREQGKCMSNRHTTRLFRRLFRYRRAIEGEYTNLIVALACFQHHKHQAASLTTTCYNYVLQALGEQDFVDTDRSLRVYRALLRDGLTPDKHTYSWLIANLSRQPDNAKAVLGFFSQMQKEKLVPTADIYRAVVWAYQSLGKPEKAEKITSFTTSVGIDLELGTYIAPANIPDRMASLTVALPAETTQFIPVVGAISLSLDHVSFNLRSVTSTLPASGAVATTQSAQRETKKARLEIPVVQRHLAELAESDFSSSRDDSWHRQREQRHREQTSHIPDGKDSSFLSTFFTSNADHASNAEPEPRPATGTSIPGEQPPAVRNDKTEDAQPSVEDTSSTRYAPAWRPPLPVSFASLGVPAVSQAFSTCTRPAVSEENAVEDARHVSVLPSLSQVGSALAALPVYLADLTFQQLAGMLRRYQLEVQASERDRDIQEALRSQIAQRADADRWRGWREAGAVPWY